MQIDSAKLQTLTNFVKEKGFTRQHVYRLIKSGEINQVLIDEVMYVLLDEKAEQFERKRKT